MVTGEVVYVNHEYKWFILEWSTPEGSKQRLSFNFEDIGHNTYLIDDKEV